MKWQLNEKERKVRTPIGKVKRMLRKGRRYLGILLVIMLALGMLGCGNGGRNAVQGNTAGKPGSDANENTTADDKNGGGAAAKGRYVETQLATPEDFVGGGSLVRLSDGSLAIFDVQNGIKSISTDEGRSWRSEAVQAVSGIAERYGDVDGAIAPDGSIFLSYIVWDESTEEKLYPEKYVYIGADGAKQEFELGLEDYRTCLTKEVFAPDGCLFAITDYKVYEIDVQNRSYQFLFELENVDGVSMCAGSRQLMVQDGHVAYFYDYESGELTTEDAVLNAFLEEQAGAKSGIVLCGASGQQEDSSLYLASRGGIYHHVQGGSVMEQLADGNLNTLGDPTRIPDSMLQLSETAFVILFQNGELYAYEYDPEVPAVPEEQLTIYGLNDNETVRRGISVFRKEHPEVFVKFEVALTGENAMTEDDAVRSLNTRLLAGEGPDLILLDGMPVDSYVEKGILVDLTAQAEKWKTRTDFFDGILEGYRRQDGLFAVPIRYEIPMVAGAGTDLDAITDLHALAETAQSISESGRVKLTVMGTYTAEELLEKLYPLCADHWVTEDRKPDEAALRAFLADAAQIYVAEQKNLSEEQKQRYAKYQEMVARFYSPQEARRVRLGMEQQTINQLLHEQILAAGYLNSMNDYRTMVSVRRKYRDASQDYQFRVWNGQDANVFIPTGIVGLCANAKNPETAEAFLETLLQKEVQKADLNDGFTVNREAFEEFVAQPAMGHQDYSLGMSNEDGELVGLEVRWPDEAETEELRNIIDTLAMHAQDDHQVREAVLSAGVKALTGERNMEESVDEILQKITLRMQE